MVYIYKKLIHGKPYYYLRVSKSKGLKTITKDIAYLGSTLEDARNTVEKLPLYANDVRRAYKKINKFLERNKFEEKAKEQKTKLNPFLSKEMIIALEACRLHYMTVFKKKPHLTQKEILKQFCIEFAFNTTAIEGNTITLNEASKLLQEGKTPANKTMREIYDVQNTETVFLDSFEQKQELNDEFLQRVHTRLLKNIDERTGYRTEDVHVFKARFESTPAHYVRTDMGLLFKWYEREKNNLSPIVLASVFHHKFEKIHPFMDGNGRTGRMVLNVLLLQNECPPSIISRKRRKDYILALATADESLLEEALPKHYAQLVTFIAEELVKNYWSIFF